MYKEKSVSELKDMTLIQLKKEYEKLAAVYAKRLAERFKEDAEAAEIAYGDRLTPKKMEKEYLFDTEDVEERERYIDAYKRLSQAYADISSKQGFERLKVAMPELIELTNRRLEEAKREEIEVEVFRDRHITDHEDFYKWSDAVLEEHPETDRSSLSMMLRSNSNSTGKVLEELYNKLKSGR